MKAPFGAVILMLCAAAPVNAQRALRQDVDEILGLSQSTTVQLWLDGSPSENVTATFVLAGTPLTLNLEPSSVRSLDFQVLELGADGVPRPVEPERPRTYRGTIDGLEDAMVAASWLDEGLFVRIRTEAGEDYWLQPKSTALPSAGADEYVLFRDEDIEDVNRLCGADVLAPVPDRARRSDDLGGVQSMVALSVAELGCDADFQYFQRYGSTTATANRIESVINSMNLQYEAEVAITHQITTILVRTSSSQPYTSTDAVTLLNQFRNEWLANQGGVQRDVAHLFTGKNLNGGTIGIAWIAAVCSSFGFGVVESDFNNNFACATDLSAHELGHNWSAQHCSCSSFTMNAFITCANTFNPSITRPQIASFRDSIDCLESGGGGGPTTVYTADFTSGAPGWNKSSGSTDLWRLSNGCVSSNRSIAFSRSGFCDYDVGRAVGWARSPAINLSGFSSATLSFRHFWQTESFSGAYDRMFVQVSANNGSSWTTILEINSSNANPASFTSEALNVSGFISSTFRIRFRFDSVDGQFNDFLGWYVDDVQVDAE